jgi:hypothetical protein
MIYKDKMSAAPIDFSVVKWSVSVGGGDTVDATIVIPRGCIPLIYSAHVAMMLTMKNECSARKYFEHLQNSHPVLKSRGKIQDHINVKNLH